MLNLGLSPRPTFHGRRTCFLPCQATILTFKSLSLLTLAASLLLTENSFAGVVINEIMYHPASGNVLESYVELRNLDNVSTNISGWRFTKGIQFTFPTNTTLGPGAYLVVAANRAAFTNKYPGVA